MSKRRKGCPTYREAFLRVISRRVDAIEAQFESSSPEQRERILGDLQTYEAIVDAIIKIPEQAALG